MKSPHNDHWYSKLPLVMSVHLVTNVQKERPQLGQSACSVPFSSFTQSYLTVTPWTEACQAFLSITNSQSFLKLKSIESVMPSKHLILWLPYPPTFNLSQHQGLFQCVSSSNKVAKVLVFQLQHQSFQWIFQDWFPFGLTGLISLQSKGLSRVFSNTTVQKDQFFGTQLPL